MSKPLHKTSEKTKAEVQALAGFGIKETDIAIYLGIDPKTLRKYYRNELDTGHIRANAAVARALYKQAVDDNSTAAAIFWLKTRAGWNERIEHTGADGGALTVVVKKFSDAEDHPAK